MNKELRKKAVLAMEFLVRNISNEDLIFSWLSVGIPDGDIEYGEWDTEVVDEYFIKDEEFSDLMRTFLKSMSEAYKDGGLYIDRVGSKEDAK